MNNRFLPMLAVATALISATSFAQSTNRAFAITSETKGTYNWNAVREIDLSTGEVVKTFYDKSKNFEVVNTFNSRIAAEGNNRNNIKLTPMAEGVAAAAFDAGHNRLYYTCMRGTELRYFDLASSTGKVVYKQDKTFFDGNRYDEGNVFTRMAFGSDGDGYAITNDGNHLVRFTTDPKSDIVDLGPLVDAKKNGPVSIHAQCSSWGGDMVGDAYGNLYVVTYRNYLFKINPNTRVTELVGQLKGLPAQFTSNGMAVDANGDIVVSSATVANSYYKVNISTLDAVALPKGTGEIYNASDLANSNLLYQNNSVGNQPKLFEVIGNNALSIYPNPVTSKVFSVQFEKIAPGKYNLLLTDASGRNVITKALTVNALGQVEKISLPRTSAGGMYFLKLTGANRQLVYSNKIVVQ